MMTVRTSGTLPVPMATGSTQTACLDALLEPEAKESRMADREKSFNAGLREMHRNCCKRERIDAPCTIFPKMYPS